MMAVLFAAQALQPSMLTLGIGAESCRLWNLHRTSGDGREADKQWMAGFITGLDFGMAAYDRSLLHEGDDPEAMIGFVDGFCRTHPLQNVAQAAQALYLQLHRRDQAIKQP